MTYRLVSNVSIFLKEFYKKKQTILSFTTAELVGKIWKHWKHRQNSMKRDNLAVEANGNEVETKWKQLRPFHAPTSRQSFQGGRSQTKLLSSISAICLQQRLRHRESTPYFCSLQPLDRNAVLQPVKGDRRRRSNREPHL
jgi:hypothetical protein